MSAAAPFTWTLPGMSAPATVVAAVYAATEDLNPREYNRRVVVLEPPASVRVMSRAALAAEYDEDVPKLARSIRTSPVPAGKILVLILGDEVTLTSFAPGVRPDELPARDGALALLGRYGA